MAAQRLTTFSENDKRLSCTLIFKPEASVATDVKIIANPGEGENSKPESKFGFGTGIKPELKPTNVKIANFSVGQNGEPKFGFGTRTNPELKPTDYVKIANPGVGRNGEPELKFGFGTNPEVKPLNAAEPEPKRMKKKMEDDIEEERLLKRQRRFGTVQESAPTTVVINGASIITRDGKVEKRYYPKAQYSTSDNPLMSPIELADFEVEATGYKSIPMNYFNRPIPFGWMGPAGVIVDYMISKGMMKEAPWNNRNSVINEPDDDPGNFGRFRCNPRWTERNTK